MYKPNPYIAVQLAGIKKVYGTRTVLYIDGFSFVQGERYALLGPNGSGKTTLLRLLARRIKADGGQLHYGVPLDKVDIGYVPQKSYAFALSVEKSIMLGADPQNADKAAALDVLASVGMLSLALAREDRLSGGEAQRLAVARILLQRRKLLLLDEPSSATDLAGTELVESAIGAYCQRHSCTLVCATHSPAQAMRLADKVVFMDGGRIIESGESKAVLYSPKSDQVRAFLRNWQL